MKGALLALRALALIAAAAAAYPAAAVPSYSRQTGDPCTSCHLGGYGPQLTPHGREFKLSGYSDGKTIVPLSATVLAGITHTAGDLSEAPRHYGVNDNAAVQEIIGFIAGRIAPHAGSFVGITYSGVDRKVMLDHFDVRYAQPLKIGGKDATWGFTLTNNPGAQDVFDTLPAWRFPHDKSELVPEVSAMPLLAGGLDGQVAGLSTYLWFNDAVYVELGGYRSLSTPILRFIGADDSAGAIAGLAPYGRFAYQISHGKQVASLGLVATRSSLRPTRQPGPTNKYTDVGLDATYQYRGKKKTDYAFDAALIHEWQDRDYDLAEGLASRRSHVLNSLRANASVYFKQSYGLTAGIFHSWGTADPDLYAPAADVGSRTGKPGTSGFIVQASWTPFGKEGSWGAPYANLRLGLQYTGYLKFNGARRNYDAFGRTAADNDTLFAFAQLAL